MSADLDTNIAPSFAQGIAIVAGGQRRDRCSVLSSLLRARARADVLPTYHSRQAKADKVEA